MKRIDDDTIQISQEELDSLREFIRNTLSSEWDHYTDNNYICSGTTWEEGMRRMNPEMYDMANEMAKL